MQISDIVDALIDLIKTNIVAVVQLTANANAGDTVVSVINSFHYKAGQEIMLGNLGYADEDSPYHQVAEYAVIKSIDDTRTMTLIDPLEGNWTTADGSFIQKALGHEPLFTENVLYGDREVIPTDEMAVTVEPVSLSNEWIYLQGGLSEEFRITLMIYGQDACTENGMKVLNKYTEAIYQLLNDNLHLNINDIQVPILGDINAGENTFCICDTPENRENFVVSDNNEHYTFQDNDTPRCIMYGITSRTISGGTICLETSCPLFSSYQTSEFAVVGKMNRYLYDSRVDSVNWGTVQKGSAVLRAAELSWFGKEVNEQRFPQFDKKTPCFNEGGDCNIP